MPAERGFRACHQDRSRPLIVIVSTPHAAAAVLYGNPEIGVSESLLVNGDRDQLLWLETSCIAKHCDAGPGHPWYPRISSGLDSIVYFYTRAAERLLDEPPEGLTMENPYFNYLWEIGTHDVNDGLEKFTRMFNEDTHENPSTVREAKWGGVQVHCGPFLGNRTGTQRRATVSHQAMLSLDPCAGTNDPHLDVLRHHCREYLVCVLLFRSMDEADRVRVHTRRAPPGRGAKEPKNERRATRGRCGVGETPRAAMKHAGRN